MSGGGGPLQGRRGGGARVLVPRFWGAGGAVKDFRDQRLLQPSRQEMMRTMMRNLAMDVKRGEW